MRGEAFRLFLLEVLLLLVFLPPFLLLPWGRTGLPAGPAVAVIGTIATLTAAYAWRRARRAEELEAWRQAAMLFGVGAGLWVWGAGLALRLGDLVLFLASLSASLLIAFLALRFPEPPGAA